jgi:hypothetical protein
MKDVLDPEQLKAAMAAVRAQRRTVDTKCEICGAVLTDVPAKRRYCSNTCRQRAWYRRHHRPADTSD